MRRALFMFGLLAIGVSLAAAGSNPFVGFWTSNNSKSTLPHTDGKEHPGTLNPGVRHVAVGSTHTRSKRVLRGW